MEKELYTLPGDVRGSSLVNRNLGHQIAEEPCQTLTGPL